MARSTLRPLFERLAYFIHLAVLALSIALVWLGVIAIWAAGVFSIFLWALVGLALGVWLHMIGYAHLHFQQCEESLAFVAPAEQWEEETLGPVADFARLLAEFEVAEDVWMRGELRRELARRLEAKPILRGVFAEELAPHPDL